MLRASISFVQSEASTLRALSGMDANHTMGDEHYSAIHRCWTGSWKPRRRWTMGQQAIRRSRRTIASTPSTHSRLCAPCWPTAFAGVRRLNLGHEILRILR